jgi:two-component system, LytTR family, response regulator
MIQCITVDDEPLALDLLEDNIQRVPFLNLVKRCNNAFEAIEVLQTTPVDLMFLDIQMPGITGLQMLKSLTKKPMIVFVTAFKNYASDGFEWDALDYLVKPVSFERFLKAANKALEYQQFKSHAPPTAILERDYIFVQAGYKLVKIELKHILYIEGLKDYVKIFLTTSPKPIVTRVSMKALEGYLPSIRFCRIHKSHIIAIAGIESIGNSLVRMADGNELRISELYRDTFLARIHSNNFSVT